jgi:predicted phosphohydrolase
MESRRIRLVALSDTHDLHRKILVPEADILIHCGDFTNKGSQEEIDDFQDWISQLPHKSKYVIAGNHEYGIFSAFNSDKLRDCNYVDNCVMTTEDNLRILGIPWKRQFLSKKLLKTLDLGERVDVIFSHEPPEGYLDGGRGCSVLLDLMLGLDPNLPETLRPRLSLFGHIHEAHGKIMIASNDNSSGPSVLVNCSLAADGMNPQNLSHSPVLLDLEFCPVRGILSITEVHGIAPPTPSIHTQSNASDYQIPHESSVEEGEHGLA